MATLAKPSADRSLTTATQRVKLSVTTQLASGESKSWNLLKPVTLIGLKRNAQIVVPEEHVNRSHAAIINTGAHVLLVDLFTDAGTYCNGRLISKELLTDGDVVRVGSTDLRFSIEMPPNPVVPRRGILSFDDPLKMPKALRLIQVETDEGWEIVDSTAIIGNCNQAEVRIHDEGIAPAHSLIFGTINGIGIMDLGSSTPLKINGNEKQMAYLRRQDRLLIGRTGLMIQFPKERGAAQGGSAGILSSTTPADESSGDWAGQFHGQTDAGSLTGRDTEPHVASGGSAFAPTDSGEVPRGERPELNSLGSKISALQSELAESWGEINEWKQKLTLEHNNLTVREQELQNKEKELRLLTAEVTAKEAGLELAKATLDSRELELREQRAKLTTVTTELEARQREGEQRQCEIAARTAELKKTKAELDSRDIALRDQQAELSAVAGELETRQREVERFAAEYETVRQEIESRRLELQTLESTIAEERSRLEDEQLCVNERSEELERKSQELCARESELSSREATILQRRADLESNQTELESQRKEIESKEDQLAAYEKSLRKREEGLSERERDIHQRSEIVTRFKQFVEEANEAYDITVNSPVEPAPEASRDVPESDDTYLRQSPTDQTVVLDRIRRERRFAVAELEEETRQLAAGLPDAEHVDEESPSDEPTTGIDLQTLEPDVRDRLRALRRIGDNGKSDSELIMQIRTELQHEGSGRAHKRPNKKSWWRA